jgi:hypothetical protein
VDKPVIIMAAVNGIYGAIDGKPRNSSAHRPDGRNIWRCSPISRVLNNGGCAGRCSTPTARKHELIRKRRRSCIRERNRGGDPQSASG